MKNKNNSELYKNIDKKISEFFIYFVKNEKDYNYYYSLYMKNKKFYNLYRNNNLEEHKPEMIEFLKFLEYLIDISKKVNIDIFKPKLYEIVGTIGNKYYSDNAMYIFKKINFTKEYTKKDQILVGELKDREFIRDCSKLKDYQCNDECFLEYTFFGFKNKCVNIDFKELILNSYCSDSSYRSKEELIKILYILNKDWKHDYITRFGTFKQLKRYAERDINKIDKDFHVNMNKKQLCTYLREEININLKKFEEIKGGFFNYVGMSDRDVVLLSNFIIDLRKNKTSFFEMFNLTNLFLSTRKYINFYFFSMIITVVFFKLLTEYFYNNFISYVNTTSYSDNEIKDKSFLLNKNMDNMGFADPKIKIEEGVDTKFLLENKINIEVLSGDNRFINIDKYNNAKSIIGIYTNPLERNTSLNEIFASYLYALKSIEDLELFIIPSVPQIIDGTLNGLYGAKNQIIDDIKTSGKIINKTYKDMTDSVKKYGVLIKENLLKDIDEIINELENSGIKNILNYNPLNQAISLLGFKIENNLIKCSKLIPTINIIDENYTKSVIETVYKFLKGKFDGLLTNSIPVIKENINNNIKYYILDGHHQWGASYIISEDTMLTCKIICLPENMKIEYFIENLKKIPGIFYKKSE